MRVQCCVCKKVKLDATWRDSPAIVDAALTHSYCPQCLEAAMQAIVDQRVAERRAKSTRSRQLTTATQV